MFVLVSATNTRQVRTIVDEIELALKTDGRRRAARVEGLDDASWVLMDFGDVIVHVFLAETRAFYDLDRLWADAPRSMRVGADAERGTAARTAQSR